MHAQRRPGHQPRRHLVNAGSAPLNEGRGINPGDTRADRRSRGRGGDLVLHAQRRPGHQPRATPTVASAGALSPFAGAYAQRRPGHQPRRHTRPRPPPLADHATLNEGRGINPGDTRTRASRLPGMALLNEGRGINPGVATVAIAQRRPGHQPRRHPSEIRANRALVFPRSTKAGASTPATLGEIVVAMPVNACRAALNEGRGINPGDTSAGRSA